MPQAVSKNGKKFGGQIPFDPPRPRPCKQCGKEFQALYGKHFFCSKYCKNKYGRLSYWQPLAVVDHSAGAGSTCEIFASFRFSQAGWHVFRPLDAYAPFDIIVFKNGITKHVEIRKGKISKNEKSVQFNRGATKERPVFKAGTDWVGIVVIEKELLLVFEVVRQTNFFAVDTQLNYFWTDRLANPPEGGDEDES